MQISRHHVGPRMTQMVIHGDTIYLCGQTAEAAEGAAAQTQAILAKIDALLAEAGSSNWWVWNSGGIGRVSYNGSIIDSFS